MLLHSLRGNRNPSQSQLGHCTVHLFNRGVDILKGNEAYGFDARTLAADVGDEVVVCARIGDGGLQQFHFSKRFLNHSGHPLSVHCRRFTS